MPHAAQIRAGVRRFGLAQHLLPLSKTRQRVVGNDAKSGEQRNLLQPFIINLRSGLARRLDGQLAAAIESRREPEEMNVVRIVGHGIEALRPTLRDVIFVSRDREFVAAHGVGIAAHALINMRGHVHHVARSRHEREQTVGGRFRFFCFFGFHQVDVQMQCAGMLRIACDDFFSERDDLRGSFVRPAVARPVTPGSEVHHRFHIQRSRVEIVRVALVRFAHGFGVRAITRFAIFSAT